MITYIPGGIVTSDGVLLDANGNPVLDEEGRPLVVAGESISPYSHSPLLFVDFSFLEHKYFNIFFSLKICCLSKLFYSFQTLGMVTSHEPALHLVCDAFRSGDAVLVVGGDGQAAAVAASMAMPPGNSLAPEAPLPQVVNGSGGSALTQQQQQQQYQEAQVQHQQQQLQQQQQHMQPQELQKGVPETRQQQQQPQQIPNSSSSPQSMSTNNPQGGRVEQTTTNSNANHVPLAADEAQGKG